MATFSINPKTTAVLAIDLQNCFIEKHLWRHRVAFALSNGSIQEAGSIIVWTRHVVRPDHADVGILGVNAPPVSRGIIDENARSSALHVAVDLAKSRHHLRQAPIQLFPRTCAPGKAHY